MASTHRQILPLAAVAALAAGALLAGDPSGITGAETPRAAHAASAAPEPARGDRAQAQGYSSTCATVHGTSAGTAVRLFTRDASNSEADRHTTLLIETSPPTSRSQRAGCEGFSRTAHTLRFRGSVARFAAKHGTADAGLRISRPGLDSDQTIVLRITRVAGSFGPRNGTSGGVSSLRTLAVSHGAIVAN